MIGLLSLGFLAGYIFLIVLAARFGAHLARRSGHNPKLWGFIAGLLVYLPVFWDFIPTLALQCYYCATQGGFTRYKTLDEWKQENPGVLETLVSPKNAPHPFEGNTDSGNYTLVFFTNDRFRWVVKNSGPHFINLWREEQEFVDVKTGEVLAKYVDFSTSQIRRQAGWSGWKFWLNSPHCEGGEMNQGHMYGVIDALRGRDEK